MGDADARDVAGDVANAFHGLVVDEVGSDDGDGLGDVDEGGVGLCACDGMGDGVGVVVAVDFEGL